MRFLLDTHIPPKLVREFTAFGHECLQVRTVLTPDASDLLIARVANELSAVMVTKDADYVELAGAAYCRRHWSGSAWAT